MLKQNERIINMENKRRVSLTNEEFRLIRNLLRFEYDRVSLTDEEFRLIKNLLRFEYDKYQLEYHKYNQPHTLGILNLIENTRRKFIVKK